MKKTTVPYSKEASSRIQYTNPSATDFLLYKGSKITNLIHIVPITRLPCESGFVASIGGQTYHSETGVRYHVE